MLFINRLYVRLINLTVPFEIEVNTVHLFQTSHYAPTWFGNDYFSRFSFSCPRDKLVTHNYNIANKS